MLTIIGDCAKMSEDLMIAGEWRAAIQDVGEVEKDYRGGKYWPEVVEFVPDVAGHGKVVHELKRHPAFQKA